MEIVEIDLVELLKWSLTSWSWFNGREIQINFSSTQKYMRPNNERPTNLKQIAKKIPKSHQFSEFLSDFL